MSFPTLTAEEAAELIPDGARLGFSGFTAAGSVKKVGRALASRAAQSSMRFDILTGASTGPGVDRALAEVGAIRWRAPYQSDPVLRKSINRQETSFLDLHLSHVPQMLDYRFIKRLDCAILEATDVTPDGRIFLTTSVGLSPSLAKHAEKIIIERNRHPSPRLWEMHDICLLDPPPRRSSVRIYSSRDRIGVPHVQVDPQSIVGIVETDEPEGIPPFGPPKEEHLKIAGHITEFLLDELKLGRIPPEFLPLQAGVGNVSNAVMAELGAHPEIPAFSMYTEVFQDSLVTLMREGKIRDASSSALFLSDDVMQELYEEMDFFAPRIVLRPQEISNNPGLVRRLGVIAINTVLEFDIYGHANSTHVCGSQIVNGIGGSGDFVRNGYLSILVAPSVQKEGRISAVVPMVSHVDHTEHSVQVLVTEQGLADLRGLGPKERAACIIDNCAHPKYREYLRDYVSSSRLGHMPHNLSRAFELHQNFIEQGSMLPD